MSQNLPSPIPKRLNVGCGFDIRPGYLNVDFVDFHKPDLVANVTDLPMLPSGYFDEVVAQDVWEHFERSKTLPALTEWARLLSPVGTLRIRVPSFYHLVDMMMNAEEADAARVKDVLHLIYGTQAYPGDYHLTGFTPVVTNDFFAAAGLVVNEVRLRDGWLFEIAASHGGVSVAEWPLARVQRSGDQVGVLQQEIDRLRADVKALHQSTSWKITAPLRRLKERIRS